MVMRRPGKVGKGCGDFSCPICYVKQEKKKKVPVVVDVGDHQEAGKKVLDAILGPEPEVQVKQVVKLTEKRHG